MAEITIQLCGLCHLGSELGGSHVSSLEVKLAFFFAVFFQEGTQFFSTSSMPFADSTALAMFCFHSDNTDFKDGQLSMGDPLVGKQLPTLT